jgi:hypothetical protein
MHILATLVLNEMIVRKHRKRSKSFIFKKILNKKLLKFELKMNKI